MQNHDPMLGVEDLARAKNSYADGFGCKIEQDYPNFVRLNLGDGSSSLAIYPRAAAAQDGYLWKVATGA